MASNGKHCQLLPSIFLGRIIGLRIAKINKKLFFKIDCHTHLWVFEALFSLCYKYSFFPFSRIHPKRSPVSFLWAVSLFRAMETGIFGRTTECIHWVQLSVSVSFLPCMKVKKQKKRKEEKKKTRCDKRTRIRKPKQKLFLSEVAGDASFIAI